MKGVILAIIILVVVMSVVGAINHQNDAPPERVAEAQQQQEQKPAPAPTPDPIPITNFSAFESETGCKSKYSDEKKADKFRPYQNKLVSVKGEIATIQGGKVGLKAQPIR